jgi:2-polyprenyl-6-methoxyphenol hydroxylase-like FAD-dependent oxidoreductase
MNDVVVIGGGLGGLSIGIALAQAGLEVTLLESRQETTTDHWGFTLWPPATRTLDSLGLIDEVTGQACHLKALRWLRADGRDWMSVNLENLSDLGKFIGILPSKLDAVLKRGAIRNGLKIIEGVKNWDYERKADKTFNFRISTTEAELLLSCKLIVGADGAKSAVRERIGVRVRKWRPPKQIILTGIGGSLEFEESRQAIGNGWSGGSVSLGMGKSWLYSIVQQGYDRNREEQIFDYGELDPQARAAMKELNDVIEISPWSQRVRRWAVDGIILMGDAAHGILPHLGLGGSLTLESIPVLTEIIVDSVRNNNTSCLILNKFQQRRSARVAYAQRISELWALSMTHPSLRYIRDYNFKRLSKSPESLETFVRELSLPKPVSARTRLKVWLF